MSNRRFLCVRVLLVLAIAVAATWSAPRNSLSAEPQAAKSDVPEPNEEQLKKEQDEEYYRLLRLFADTLDQVDRNYVKDISRRELMEAAIEGMLSKLDQYSNYIPPKEIDRFRTGVESEFGGIGIQVSIERGVLTVISPIVGSPAYDAGMIAGDKIVEIEGKDARGISLDDAIKKLKGKVGTKVKISVLHPGDDEPEEITLKRDIVRVATVIGHHRNEDDSWNFIYDEDAKLGYIRVTSFSRHTIDELRTALKGLVKTKISGLVIDLRFNPGGLLSSAIQVCDLFVSKGRIVSTEGRNTPKRVWDAHAKGTYDGFPIAVLVNKYSASASEIVSACLQDHQRGVVIGERTWGKGSVQNIIELEGGQSALKLTTAGYMRPSGKNIHKFEGATDEDDWGVSPNDGFVLKLDEKETGDLLRFRREHDLLKEADPDEEQPEFVDRQLNKALDYLKSQLAKESAEEKTEKKESAGG